MLENFMKLTFTISILPLSVQIIKKLPITAINLNPLHPPKKSLTVPKVPNNIVFITKKSYSFSVLKKSANHRFIILKNKSDTLLNFFHISLMKNRISLLKNIFKILSFFKNKRAPKVLTAIQSHKNPRKLSIKNKAKRSKINCKKT